MRYSLIALACACALSACSQAPEQRTNSSETIVQQPVEQLESGVYLQNFDSSVKPGDDFFQYVNGSWLEKTDIPADKASYGAFHILHEKSQEDVMAIINEASAGNFAAGSDEQKVGDLYSSYMDMDTRNALGVTPLQPELAKIAALQNKTDLAAYFAYANRYGYGAPFAINQYVDFKNPQTYMIYAWQGGIGLPEREYYFKDDEATRNIRAKYQAHIATVLTLAGIDGAEAKAQSIMALETRIAGEHMKKEQTRDMVALYNKYPLDQLSDLMPDFAWDVFMRDMQLTSLDGLVVTQVDYMKALNQIIQDTDMDTWKAFLQWHLVNANAARLNDALDQANFEFYSKVMQGVEEQLPQWRRGVNLLNGHVGEVIGKVYVKKHFPPEAKARMEKMVQNLLLAYEQSIKQLDWMTEETRVQALDKLSKFTPKIGYPDKWQDYTALTISKDDLFGNLRRSAEVKYAQMLEKQQGPVRKYEWNMTPQTVNAYYSPPSNEIVFPAAILQPPFFNMEAEDAVNYGGIGAVIGHEIGHGFDDSGSTFDGDGVLRNWWTDNDRDEFKRRTSELVAQYSGFQALPDLNVNGEFTLGENIGDLGGISIALKAYHLSLNGQEAPVMDGFTGDQRVFIGFGQVWAAKQREEALRTQVSTDPHSPAKFRANGSVRNVPEFYTAFDVKPGDALYLAPEQRVKIW
ncbi:M13 family metallopeptidase [Bowmanella sp. JS7-9]|uniref:M13 family metallopeptidase n=1 Tax=Pseudobowmanella zhangzhouensis TaxID=1537679 RepID=A0ABW1XN88_9ALTE|nr:M13-type metalloendopeptidase [Bowmanella sp. JS7-9]TBX24459.1 peptidase M13 [Bowmanella sp. JS7-9]